MFEGGFGVDGVEVDEPGFEQRPRHLLQRLVHPPVQLDLVVQRAKGMGDSALFFKFSWHIDWEVTHFIQRDTINRTSMDRSRS